MEARTIPHRRVFFGKEILTDYLNPDDLYLTRYHLVRTPWFGVYVHVIHRPDRDRYLHDHPWSFASFVLRGGYMEEKRKNRDSFTIRKTHRAGSFHRMRTRDGYHSIRTLLRVPTWTLVFRGGRVKDWGYLTPRGWVDHVTVAREEQMRMLLESQSA